MTPGPLLPLVSIQADLVQLVGNHLPLGLCSLAARQGSAPAVWKQLLPGEGAAEVTAVLQVSGEARCSRVLSAVPWLSVRQQGQVSAELQGRPALCG